MSIGVAAVDRMGWSSTKRRSSQGATKRKSKDENIWTRLLSFLRLFIHSFLGFFTNFLNVPLRFFLCCLPVILAFTLNSRFGGFPSFLLVTVEVIIAQPLALGWRALRLAGEIFWRTTPIGYMLYLVSEAGGSGNTNVRRNTSGSDISIATSGNSGSSGSSQPPASPLIFLSSLLPCTVESSPNASPIPRSCWFEQFFLADLLQLSGLIALLAILAERVVNSWRDQVLAKFGGSAGIKEESCGEDGDIARNGHARNGDENEGDHVTAEGEIGESEIGGEAESMAAGGGTASPESADTSPDTMRKRERTNANRPPGIDSEDPRLPTLLTSSWKSGEESEKKNTKRDSSASIGITGDRRSNCCVSFSILFLCWAFQLHLCVIPSLLISERATRAALMDTSVKEWGDHEMGLSSPAFEHRLLTSTGSHFQANRLSDSVSPEVDSDSPVFANSDSPLPRRISSSSDSPTAVATQPMSAMHRASTQPYASHAPIKTISVILAAHNEHEFLGRTIASIYETTPRDVLKEIIVVDDGSSPPLAGEDGLGGFRHEAGKWLRGEKEEEDGDEEEEGDEDKTSEVTASGKERSDFYGRTDFRDVVVIRNEKRLGLVKSKMIGGNAASGEMLMFLDAHVKPDKDWYKPLLAHVNVNYKRVVVPIIPMLDGETWEVNQEAVGIKMMFDWGLSFNWFEDFNDLVPCMSGGLFAISKDWWHESGEYDYAMLLWGGENIEQSIRIWLCGGEIYVARDSKVAHVFRTKFPYAVNTTEIAMNKVRTVETWFDEFKEYYYRADPYAASLTRSIGDISNRLSMRKDLQCGTFSDYIEKFRPILEERKMLPVKTFMLRMQDTNSNLIPGSSTTSTNGNGNANSSNSLSNSLFSSHRCLAVVEDSPDFIKGYLEGKTPEEMDLEIQRAIDAEKEEKATEKARIAAMKTKSDLMEEDDSDGDSGGDSDEDTEDDVVEEEYDTYLKLLPCDTQDDRQKFLFTTQGRRSIQITGDAKANEDGNVGKPPKAGAAPASASSTSLPFDANSDDPAALPMSLRNFGSWECLDADKGMGHSHGKHPHYEHHTQHTGVTHTDPDSDFDSEVVDIASSSGSPGQKKKSELVFPATSRECNVMRIASQALSLRVDPASNNWDDNNSGLIRLQKELEIGEEQKKDKKKSPHKNKHYKPKTWCLKAIDPASLRSDYNQRWQRRLTEHQRTQTGSNGKHAALRSEGKAAKNPPPSTGKISWSRSTYDPSHRLDPFLEDPIVVFSQNCEEDFNENSSGSNNPMSSVLRFEKFADRVAVSHEINGPKAQAGAQPVAQAQAVPQARNAAEAVAQAQAQAVAQAQAEAEAAQQSAQVAAQKPAVAAQ